MPRCVVLNQSQTETLRVHSYNEIDLLNYRPWLTLYVSPGKEVSVSAPMGRSIVKVKFEYNCPIDCDLMINDRRCESRVVHSIAKGSRVCANTAGCTYAPVRLRRNTSPQCNFTWSTRLFGVSISPGWRKSETKGNVGLDEYFEQDPTRTIVAVRVYSESLHARASVTSLHYFVVFELSSNGCTSYFRVDRMNGIDEYRWLPTLQDALNTCKLRTGQHRPTSSITMDRPVGQLALFKILKVLATVEFSSLFYNCFWFTGTLLNMIIWGLDCGLSKIARDRLSSQAVGGLMAEKSLSLLRLPGSKFWEAISVSSFSVAVSLCESQVFRDAFEAEYGALSEEFHAAACGYARDKVFVILSGMSVGSIMSKIAGARNDIGVYVPEMPGKNELGVVKEVDSAV